LSFIALATTNNSVLHQDLSFITLAATNNSALHQDLSFITLATTNNSALHQDLSLITPATTNNTAFHFSLSSVPLPPLSVIPFNAFVTNNVIFCYNRYIKELLLKNSQQPGESLAFLCVMISNGLTFL